MKTIIVDHDLPTEITTQARLNRIIPILRAWGAENLYTPWANQTLDDGIITPAQINDYLDSDYKIIYAITARIPEPNDRDPEAAWLRGISTEVPANIIKLANKGKLHIAFFVGEIFTLTIDEILREVNNQMHFAGINQDSMTIYVPNFKVEELEVSHIRFISIFEMSYNYILNNRTSVPLKENIIQTVNLEARNKKFTCLNHFNKTHRLCFAAALYNAGKHEEGYFSYHLTPLMQGEPAEFITTVNANNFLGHCPFQIDTLSADEVNHHGTILKPFFNDAYWNFVTESFFEEHSTITEKTFKPIVNLQPFIVVGAPHTLAKLHDLGYQTFSSVINEAYDYLEDPDRRMAVLIETALNLINMSDRQHIRIMEKIKPILEHNQRVFFEKHWKDFI